MNIYNMTKEEIKTMAIQDSEMMNFLGGEIMIENRDVETLQTLTECFFSLNNEVGAFYDRNGF